MKRGILVLMICAAVLKIYAQGKITVEPFKKLAVSSTANIRLVKSTDYGVSINGDYGSNFFSINNQQLTITAPKDYQVTVYLPTVEEIKVSGNAEIISEDTLMLENLEVNISGKLKLGLGVNAKTININTSGIGSGSLSGVAENLTLNVSGTQKLDASKLVVNKVSANVSGVCKTTVDVRNELNTSISGSGSIYYIKAPPVINKNNSGAVKIGEAGEADTKDTTKVQIGGFDISISEKDGADMNKDTKKKSGKSKSDSEPHWGGLELGFNGYLPDIQKTAELNEGPAGYNYLDLNSGKSIVVNLNLWEVKANIVKRLFWFNTGLGFTWNNYRFNNSREILLANTDTMKSIMYGRDLAKNKLLVTYATVPLMFEVSTNRKESKAFHIGAGVVAGYRIGTHLKLKTSDNTNKVRDDYNVNPLRLDARAVIGYRSINLFAQYGLTDLFRENRAPALRPFSIGITVLGW
ncbi:MAG: DUF2807 domain-containing protein [Bacteroidetes bacterium]|nr:DUF2807 domain-containing protein [Bacteroidota bacterium]